MAKRIIKAVTAPSPIQTPATKVAEWIVKFTSFNGKRGGYHLETEQKINSLDFDRLLNGFWEAFGVPRAVVTSEFREFAKKVFKRGKLRKSALRWLMEGKIPGVPQPVYKYRYPKRLHEVLLLADLAETLVFELMTRLYSEEKEANELIEALEELDGRTTSPDLKGTPNSGSVSVSDSSVSSPHGAGEHPVPGSHQRTRSENFRDPGADEPGDDPED